MLSLWGRTTMREPFLGAVAWKRQRERYLNYAITVQRKLV